MAFIAQPHIQQTWGWLGTERLLDNARRWFAAWDRK